MVKRPRSPFRSLKVSDGFRALVLDNLEELGALTAKSMFGGVGLYCGSHFFGLIAQDTLYLKVDDQNRNDYERLGLQPFRPYPDRSGSMSYYAVPIDIVESPLDLVRWAKRSVAVAERATAVKRTAKRAR